MILDRRNENLDRIFPFLLSFKSFKSFCGSLNLKVARQIMETKKPEEFYPEMDEPYFNEKLMVKALKPTICKETSDFRLQLIDALNVWFDVPENVLDVLQSVEENFAFRETLREDIAYPFDFEDLNLEYSLSDAINAYYYHTFLIRQKASALKNLTINELYRQSIGKLATHVGIDEYWSNVVQCPSMEQYLWKLRKWVYFELAANVMSLYSNTTIDTSKLNIIMAYLFGISQDYKRLIVETAEENHDCFGDVSKRTFTFPVVHALNKNPNNNKLLDMLRLRTRSMDIKKYFLFLLEESGSIDYTKRNIKFLAEEGLKEVRRIGENPLMESIITKLAEL